MTIEQKMWVAWGSQVKHFICLLDRPRMMIAFSCCSLFGRICRSLPYPMCHEILHSETFYMLDKQQKSLVTSCPPWRHRFLRILASSWHRIVGYFFHGLGVEGALKFHSASVGRRSSTTYQGKDGHQVNWIYHRLWLPVIHYLLMGWWRTTARLWRLVRCLRCTVYHRIC